MKIAYIAYQCGYRDVSYFLVSLKRKQGFLRRIIANSFKPKSQRFCRSNANFPTEFIKMRSRVVIQHAKVNNALTIINTTRRHGVTKHESAENK